MHIQTFIRGSYLKDDADKANADNMIHKDANGEGENTL